MVLSSKEFGHPAAGACMQPKNRGVGKVGIGPDCQVYNLHSCKAPDKISVPTSMLIDTLMSCPLEKSFFPS